MWYTFALLVHILGAAGLFVAVSLIILAFVRIKQYFILDKVSMA